MRTVVAFALTLALQGTALTAPFVHAHPDDDATDHHGGRAVHSHWSGHARAEHAANDAAIRGGSGTRFLDHPDPDRAVYLTAFVAVTAAVFFAPAAPPAVYAGPASVERAAHRRIEVVRSHDPPCLASLSPRAPPAFLS